MEFNMSNKLRYALPVKRFLNKPPVQTKEDKHKHLMKVSLNEYKSIFSKKNTDKQDFFPIRES